MRLRNSVSPASGTFTRNGRIAVLSAACVALVWVTVSSFSSILESANASPLVAGPKATATPNIELTLRKRRRDLASGCPEVVSVMRVLPRRFGSGSSRDRIFLEQTRHQRRIEVSATTDDRVAVECEHHALAVVESHPVLR